VFHKLIRYANIIRYDDTLDMTYSPTNVNVRKIAVVASRQLVTLQQLHYNN
jgi:hypothetical protein